MRLAKKPYTMAIFFVFALIFLSSWSFKASGSVEVGIFGGPAASSETGEDVWVEEASGAVLASPNPNEARTTAAPSEPAMPDGLTVSLYAQGGILGSSGRSGMPITYNVAEGDTLSKIAQKFGISVDTIISSNPEVKSRALQIGQGLTILPVSGVLYEIKSGDTLGSIADSFKVSASQIREFNRSIDLDKPSPGTTLIIPGVSISGSPAADGNLPDLSAYFLRPADGVNWGKLHSLNAVDIANACGTPIKAAAEGLVVNVAETDWNSGYGIYIQLEHPNGTRTRYAHLESIKSELGDYVEQGEEIGKMGKTGEATGCHLHFEVEGARNPFTR